MLVEFTDDHGVNHKTSIRAYYNDQPYWCKRCSENHVGDCPRWLQEKTEKEKVKTIKADNSRTTMVGDSNFRCLNKAGVMASVTAVSGGKLGHIINQVGFENLNNIDNVIISAGSNNLNDIEDLEPESWKKRTTAEITKAESQVAALMALGKNVIISAIAPTPKVTSTKQRREARQMINSNLADMVARLGKKESKGKVNFVEDNDGNFTASTDFSDDRHLTQHAVERLVSTFDLKLPNKQKLKNNMLNQRPTCLPYKGCYSTYPLGCTFCTGMFHGEDTCPQKQQAEKRKRSSGSQNASGTTKQQKT